MAPSRTPSTAGGARPASTAGRSALAGGRRAAQSNRSSVSTRAGFAPGSRLNVQKIIAAVQRMPLPAPKKQAKKKLPASRPGASSYLGSALSVFSPMSPSLVPTLTASGKSFPVTGMYRKTIEHNPNQRRIYVFSNTGESANVMLIGSMDVTGSSSPGWDTFSAPTVALDHSSGAGPTAGRAMKMGATVVNATAKLTASGRVFVLNCDQRLLLGAAPSLLTRSMYNAFCDSVVNHPNSREYSGSDFGRPHSWYSHVVDPVHYEKFTTWQGAQSIDDYAEHWATWEGDAPEDRSMSTIVIVAESPPAVQSYTFSGRGSWYTRWPLNTVLGQTSREIPVASQTTLNAHMKYAASAASEPAYVSYE